MRGTLIVTNDFPPRQGGIQSFVHGLACLLPPGQVAVYAPAWDGAKNFDARQPFPVVRHPTSLMLPVPSVGRRAAAVLRDHDFDTVLFGAAAPGAAGARPAACGGHPPGGPHPRARGGLGRAPGRAGPAAPDRRQRRRGDLPG